METMTINGREFAVKKLLDVDREQERILKQCWWKSEELKRYFGI